MVYAIGLIIGSLLGLTGAGGSVFAVPLLVIATQLPAKQAMGVALGAVAFSALYGVIQQRKNVLWIPGLIIATGGMTLAPVGNWLAGNLDDAWLMAGFSVLAINIAVKMWRQANQQPELTKITRAGAQESIPTNNMSCRLSETGVFHLGFRCVSGLFLGGLGIGLLSGLFGVGGGFLIVPFLIFLSQLPMQSAVATSLFTIVLISSTGFIAHLGINHHFNYALLLKIVVAGVLGMALSQRLAKHLAGPTLQKVFSILLATVSIATLFTL
ncbi:hypothetical protein TDB9533_00288 [Thalassocella blandensis]|nr:hypothetical protein TDB9533_00288 [Thalassocella blandensis]